MKDLEQTDGAAGKHGAARLLAEQAIAAQAAGDQDKADRLFAEADRADPDAVVAALQEHAGDPDDGATAADAGPQDDAEIEAMSRTVEPGSDAPSRSGMSGRGSGADNQGQ
jgi:hypothetical protein